MKAEQVDRFHWRPGPTIKAWDLASGPDRTVITIYAGDGDPNWRVEQARRELQADNPGAEIRVVHR